jgi:hypothetical protein
MIASLNARAARAHARAIIAEKIQNFGLCMLSMKPEHVREIYQWMASDSFVETCHLADVDAGDVEAKFTELIDRGNRYSVNFAL